MKKSDQAKELLLSQLEKTPIVEAACQKVGVSRMTYYRYRQDDPEFAQKADEAIATGRSLVNDLAESQLIGAVKERNLPAITYWLRHHHPDYATTIQIKHGIQDENLTPEQEALVREALRLASITQDTLINPNDQSNDNSESGEHATEEKSAGKPNELQERDPAGIGGGDDPGQEGPSGDH